MSVSFVNLKNSLNVMPKGIEKSTVRGATRTRQHSKIPTRSSGTRSRPNPTRAFDRFRLACEHWDRGDTRRAFRLFLASAKADDVSSQLNLGYFYDQGIGVLPNQRKALHWHRRAYRGGEAAGATNIAIILRDQGQVRNAISWFKRALRGGDDDAALDLAQLYFKLGSPQKAGPLLRKACQSTNVTEATRETAARLLKKLKARKRVPA
jgi:TPR repeat protein